MTYYENSKNSIQLKQTLHSPSLYEHTHICHRFLPNLNGRGISDIFFLDSLTGWAVTPFTQQNDTVFVTKTTNAGDNWFISYIGSGQFVGMKRIFFLNHLTGFSCGKGLNNSAINNFAKTTDGGILIPRLILKKFIIHKLKTFIM